MIFALIFSLFISVNNAANLPLEARVNKEDVGLAATVTNGTAEESSATTEESTATETTTTRLENDSLDNR